MALGNKTSIVEETEDSGGNVAERVRVRDPIASGAGADALADLRFHVSLDANYEPGNQYRLELGKAIKIDPGGLFTKYEVTVGNLITLYIGIDRQPNDNPGSYDDVIQQGGSRVDNCLPARALYVFLPTSSGLPTDPVEVYLYAGKPARPV